MNKRSKGARGKCGTNDLGQRVSNLMNEVSVLGTDISIITCELKTLSAADDISE